MRRFLYITTLFLPFLLLSCELDSGSSYVPSSVARLKAFAFAKNDTMPGLSAAVFTVEERIDTGLVYNKDSMLYGTDLRHVAPKFSFAATPSAAYLTFPDTMVVLTGYDTLDFTQKPIYLTIRSADKKNTKTYEIRATVHQVDPDLYTWTCLNEGIYPHDDSEQRVVTLNNDFVLIQSNGFELFVYQSADGSDWTPAVQPEGLPYGTKVRQIISDGNTLYYGQGTTIYSSTDAVHWTAHTTAYPVVTMLLHWNECIWTLVEQDGYELATWQDGQLQLTGLRPEGEFPVSDFATVTFRSASLRERAMIIGGFAENGKSLNTRWNLEYSRHTPEHNGYRLQEFSIDRPHFTSLTGISVVQYKQQLLLFGGVDDKMQYFGRDILVSVDEGLNWTPADTTKNRLPDVYSARQKQSAIVRDNYIYLFGGQDATTTFSDVYRGRLNSIEWE